MIFALFMVIVLPCNAQDDYYQQIKPTQPASLFTQAGFIENINTQKSSDRVINEVYFQYAANINNALIAYLPLLDITHTKQFGLADLTLKYTAVIKRNILPHFVAIFAGLQSGVPAGSPYDGLGSGRWIIEPSLTGVFKINQNITFVATVNYLYYTPSYIKKYKTYPYNGYNYSPYMSIKIIQPLYFATSLSYTRLYSHGKSTTYSSGQISCSYLFHHSKYNLNAYWSPAFIYKSNTFNAGMVVYFRKK